MLTKIRIKIKIDNPYEKITFINIKYLSYNIKYYYLKGVEKTLIESRSIHSDFNKPYTNYTIGVSYTESLAVERIERLVLV